MLVLEAHFLGSGCSRVGDGNHPSMGKGNNYMLRILIIRLARTVLVSMHRLIEVDRILWKKIV